ncbi:DUF4260 domain-containing protein [Flagellimonas myxillae]|uniref:DUF4260 domain-containing protein n=1 Tax=Flagellimonas myxillae TaxID=2942214 RepID=UPI00201F23B0|nr:DUF4260 domain-containing protein [Muricauda myxillae]MCL6267142.1 DUF4260 domain-containing protein [Muricauda myxillae]
MRTLLKIEELLMLGLGIFLFSTLDFSWWWFLALILTPDIGMLGYLAGNKMGALVYNVFHHKGLAIVLYILGVYLSEPLLQLVGIILFSHASMDRIFGYGLKYGRGFNHTHLGKIGKENG